jgi:hypothetical protein
VNNKALGSTEYERTSNVFECMLGTSHIYLGSGKELSYSLTNTVFGCPMIRISSSDCTNSKLDK